MEYAHTEGALGSTTKVWDALCLEEVSIDIKYVSRGVIMKNILQNAKNTCKLCAIYSNPEETDRFAVGYVEYCDENLVILRAFDFYGSADGFVCLEMDSIINVETDSKYLNAMELLIDKTVSHKKFVDFSQQQSISSVLEFACQQQCICAISLCESQRDDVVGFVASVTADTAQFNVVDSYGQRNGTCVVNVMDVSSVSVLTMDTTRLEKLYSISN